MSHDTHTKKAQTWIITSVMKSRYAYRSWYSPCTVANTNWYTCIMPIQPICSYFTFPYAQDEYEWIQETSIWYALKYFSCRISVANEPRVCKALFLQMCDMCCSVLQSLRNVWLAVCWESTLCSSCESVPNCCNTTLQRTTTSTVLQRSAASAVLQAQSVLQRSAASTVLQEPIRTASLFPQKIEILRYR